MALIFPQKQEIQLKKSPLNEVVCQVKFPPILRIANELPIEFQDAIRTRFPGLEIERGVLVKLPSINGADIPHFEPSPKIFRFSTSDGKASVALTTDFFALSTKGYSHWSDFLSDLSLVEKTVRDIFQPAYGIRIGLRFINKFTKENTDCKTTQELLTLFRNELICLIQTDAWEELDEMFSQLIVRDNHSKLAIRRGFGTEQKEPFFLLDFDYFEEGQIGLDNLVPRMERYHSCIYDAFRWCIKDESLARFQPVTGV